MRLIPLFVVASMTLAACTGPIAPISNGSIANRPIASGPLVASTFRPSVQAPDQIEVDVFATRFLDSIQAVSFAERREFCGYFFRTPSGELGATKPRPGTFASCSMPAPRRGSGVFASYHTHGAFGAQYDNEVPSTTDLLSDFQLGLDGYISTPGGRIWRVNHQTRVATQLCGLNCVDRDPGFIPRNEGNVRQRYTVQTLSERNNGV